MTLHGLTKLDLEPKNVCHMVENYTDYDGTCTTRIVFSLKTSIIRPKNVFFTHFHQKSTILENLVAETHFGLYRLH